MDQFILPAALVSLCRNPDTVRIFCLHCLLHFGLFCLLLPSLLSLFCLLLLSLFSLYALCIHPPSPSPPHQVVAARAREGLLVCLGLQPALIAQAIVDDTNLCINMVRLPLLSSHTLTPHTLTPTPSPPPSSFKQATILSEFFLALPFRVEDASTAFPHVLASWM